MRFDSLGNCGCALTDLVYTHLHTHTRTRTHTHAHAHTHTRTNTHMCPKITDQRLLPETFVVLIFALLNSPRPPDVGQAKMVLESMEMQEGMPAEGGTGQGAMPGWNMLCT